MPDATPAFVTTYLALRRREGWLYEDVVAQQLPQLPAHLPNAAAWKVRARSALRFRNYLKTAGTPLRILEVGCGNGWLSHYLATALPTISVTGIDINAPELEQAQRLFQLPNLEYGNSTLEDLDAGEFDVVLFAASFQYFEHSGTTLQNAFRQLADGGSVHIIDTPIYQRSAVPAARQRSLAYFARQEAGAMGEHYFHHCFEELAPYKYKVRNELHLTFGRFTVTRFPWIQINKPS